MVRPEYRGQGRARRRERWEHQTQQAPSEPERGTHDPDGAGIGGPGYEQEPERAPGPAVGGVAFAGTGAAGAPQDEMGPETGAKGESVSQEDARGGWITRRRFLGAATGAALAVGALPGLPKGAVAQSPSGGARAVARLVDLVNPFVGVEDEGQTVPGAKVPFGFAAVSPDTTDPGEFYNTSGYDPNGEIRGFSQTHVSGTGGRGKYGNFRLTPLSGEPRVTDLASSKEAETASPGYYSVVLTRSGVKAELTATRLCGFHRYTFPEDERPVVVLDATSVVEIDNRAVPTPVSFRQRPAKSEVRVVGEDRIEGSVSFEGGWNPGPYTEYGTLRRVGRSCMVPPV